MQTVACVTDEFSNGCSRGLEQPFEIARQCFRFCPFSAIADGIGGNPSAGLKVGDSSMRRGGFRNDIDRNRLRRATTWVTHIRCADRGAQSVDCIHHCLDAFKTERELAPRQMKNESIRRLR